MTGIALVLTLIGVVIGFYALAFLYYLWAKKRMDKESEEFHRALREEHDETEKPKPESDDDHDIGGGD